MPHSLGNQQVIAVKLQAQTPTTDDADQKAKGKRGRNISLTTSCENSRIFGRRKVRHQADDSPVLSLLLTLTESEKEL